MTDSKGNVWVAASDIVTKIVPAELDFKTPILHTYVTKINGRKLAYNAYNQPFAIEEGINTIKINFEAVGMERPYETEYRYRMMGCKRYKDWSDWQKEDIAVMDDFGSGDYTFEVQSKPINNDIYGGNQSAKIIFKIDLPFYREPNFNLWLIGFVAFGLLSVMFWFNKKRINDQKEAQKQENLLNNQKIEAERKDFEIKYFQIQTLESPLNPHFIFNILQSAKMNIGIGNDEVSRNMIMDLGKMMRHFLESSISSNLKKMSIKNISLAKEIELLNLYITFEKNTAHRKFDYAIAVDKRLNIENISILPMMIQPFAENAIKHGIGGETERRCRLVCPV